MSMSTFIRTDYHAGQIFIPHRPQAIRRFDMSCAQTHWVWSKPIHVVMELKFHEPTMAIGYSLCMCAQNVDSTNPGRSNLVFRSKPIAEAVAYGDVVVPLF